MRSNDQCQYPGSHTLSQLNRAQARVSQLENELASARQPHSLSQTQSYDSASESQSLRSGKSSESIITERQEDVSPHVGLDEHGEVTFHGPTSRFSAGPIDEFARRRRSDDAQSVDFAGYSGMLQQVWQPLIASKTEADLGAPPMLVMKLLTFYWTWQYPLHNYIYKPCFIMDMALGGPYYSKFLLHCILALAARHLKAEDEDNKNAHHGETFLEIAKGLLVNELGAPRPSIPTIQGLLILSGRQCAVGKTSEGWLYAGMAFRMLSDLGLHLDMNHLAKLENFSPTCLEVRKRLCCSAYIWDKSLSLSLGRPPMWNTLSETNLNFLDHGDDEEPWLPQGFPDYPPTRTNNTMCFQYFCRLGQIIMLLMRPLPDGTRSGVFEYPKTLETKLFAWYEKLPTEIKLLNVGTYRICPPPHILSLNLLYQTLHVILWRPYMKRSKHAEYAREVCMAKAQTVNELFLLYGSSFNWSKMTYLVSYCVYTAATINVEAMKTSSGAEREEAVKRLAISLRILESEAQQTPGIQRSVNIIKKQLRSWNPPISSIATQLDVSIPAQSQELSCTTVPFTHSPPPDSSSLPMDQASGTASFGSEDIFAFDFTDTGAGFHTDIFPWSFDDAYNSYNF